jgi:hypothetical protein
MAWTSEEVGGFDKACAPGGHARRARRSERPLRRAGHDIPEVQREEVKGTRKKRWRGGLPAGTGLDIIKCLQNGRPKGMGAIAAEFLVDVFQSVDEIEDSGAGIWSAGCGTEVGAATEGAGFIDEATGGGGLKERTGSVGTLG